MFRQFGRLMIRGLMFLSLIAIIAPAIAQGDIAIQFREQDGKTIVAVTGLPEETLSSWREQLSKSPAESPLRLYVGDASDDRPPVLGKYMVHDGELRFAPRFKLNRGTTYRAVLRLEGLAENGADEKTIEREYTPPDTSTPPATRVTAIYPSGDDLPENLLRFYVHFSSPVRTADPYRLVRLVDQDGEEVERPFVELHQALWNPEGTRLTLLLDPGRVKEGLVPREEFGPILREGREYTLEISDHWRDAAGNRLVSRFVKRFRVSPPDHVQPDPRRWKLTPPHTGTTDPLVIDLDEPLDHAMLSRVVTVLDELGRTLPGRMEVSEGETGLVFHPEHAWDHGNYALSVETTLEDRAGNSVGRPFEVDLFEKIDTIIERETVESPFRIQ